MSRWEYAQIERPRRLEDAVTLWFLEIGGNHIEKWLAKYYPEGSVASDQFSSEKWFTIPASGRKAKKILKGKIHTALLEVLLSAGWEPFAIDDYTLHLRRKLES